MGPFGQFPVNGGMPPRPVGVNRPPMAPIGPARPVGPIGVNPVRPVGPARPIQRPLKGGMANRLRRPIGGRGMVPLSGMRAL